MFALCRREKSSERRLKTRCGLSVWTGSLVPTASSHGTTRSLRCPTTVFPRKLKSVSDFSFSFCFGEGGVWRGGSTGRFIITLMTDTHTHTQIYTHTHAHTHALILQRVDAYYLSWGDCAVNGTLKSKNWLILFWFSGGSKTLSLYLLYVFTRCVFPFGSSKRLTIFGWFYWHTCCACGLWLIDFIDSPVVWTVLLFQVTITCVYCWRKMRSQRKPAPSRNRTSPVSVLSKGREWNCLMVFKLESLTDSNCRWTVSDVQCSSPRH